MSTCDKNISQKAFSLIELIIVIAVIGIMSAFVFVAFDKKPTHLDAMSRQLSSDIRALHRSTLSGTVPSGITGPVCGFGIHRDGTVGYTLFVITKHHAGGDCNSSYSKTVGGGQGFSTKVLEYGVQLTQGSSDLYFEVPHGAVSGVSNYRLTLDGKDYHICVSNTGEVTENKETPC